MVKVNSWHHRSILWLYCYQIRIFSVLHGNHFNLKTIIDRIKFVRCCRVTFKLSIFKINFYEYFKDNKINWLRIKSHYRTARLYAVNSCWILNFKFLDPPNTKSCSITETIVFPWSSGILNRIKNRGHPELNQGPLDLQSNALPLSYIPVGHCVR